MTDCQILILTWQQDLIWLDYCLKSIKKFWKGTYPPFIIATSECEGRMPASSEGCRIIYEPQWGDHHRGQIYAKMNADNYVETPLILITDSDCIFTRTCSVEDFCHQGRPIICMESYTNLIPRSIIPDQNCFQNYQSIIGSLLHIIPEHEYMRRHPFLFYRDHIRDVREKIESMNNASLKDIMERYHSGYFSEFNFFGAYCRHYHKDMYYWQDIWSAPDPIIHQFHSHSERPDAGVAGEIVSNILR